MRRWLIGIIFLLVSLPAGATTLSGSINYPNSSGLTGRIFFTLSQQGAQLSTGGCGGPAVLVPTAPVIYSITAGTIQGGAAVVGNDCIAPANTYYIVQVRDSLNNILFSQNWQVTGSSENIGAILPVIVPQGTISIGFAFITDLVITGTCTLDGSPCSSGGGGAVSSVFGRTGAVIAQIGDYSCSQVIGCGSAASPNFPLTVGGVVTSGGIPCFNSTTNMETSALLPAGYVVLGGGAGACVSASQTLPNGTAATTQTLGDASTRVATDAFVLAEIGTVGGAFSDAEVPSGAINSINTSYLLAHTPSPAGSLILVLARQVLAGGGIDYSLVGASIAMTSAPVSGDSLLAWYRY